MAWFRCFIRGENFPGELVGEAGAVGFYVTWFVEAADAGAAEAIALRVLRGEPKLSPPPGSTLSGQAKVFFEKVEELTADQVPAVQPGFVWHPMGDAGA